MFWNLQSYSESEDNAMHAFSHSYTKAATSGCYTYLADASIDQFIYPLLGNQVLIWDHDIEDIRALLIMTPMDN